MASSCMRVLPRTMPLASMSRDTRAELLHGILPAQNKSDFVRALASQAQPDVEDSKLVHQEPDQHSCHVKHSPFRAGVPASVGYLSSRNADV